jgi:transposase
MTYSLDFRKKVLQIKQEEHLSMAETAERFGVGVASIMRWTKKIAPKLIRERPAIKIDMEALKKDVELYPDAYLSERAKRFNVVNNSIWLALKRLNVTCKKNASAPESRSRKTIYILPEH